MEGDPGPQPGEEPVNLENQNPQFLVSQYQNVTDFLATYGWFLLIGVVLVVYLKQRFAPQIDKLRRSYEERNERANYDEDRVRQREEAMEAARRRMQEQHSAKAEKYAEEQRLKEEEKRKQKIEDWERHQEGKGYRSKYRPEDQPSTSSATGSGSQPKRKTVYRSAEYNPLMGGGGGAGYRPSRRTGGGGGG